MTLHIPFDNSYAALNGPFYTRQNPEPVPAPRLLAFNDALAAQLGVTKGDPRDVTETFAGNAIPLGAAPLAQLYAGHQFGNWNPQLGDGRAVLLGEVVGTDGQRYDIQLKGSGRTPYSRGGDGRAWLGPVLREYVVSEAMHALGIPTTRALAAVATGQDVYRETALPGAVLTRVAASHIRVGTFQIFAARGQTEALQQLFEYTIARHYPEAETPLDLLNAVMRRQARLIAQWMGVGFIHGVMNTDNCTLSGETIDYGPCAFMDRYHPNMVYSSIDRMGRYAYDNQPDIILWNMAQLATSLVPLMPDADGAIAEFTRAIHQMPGLIQTEWEQVFRAKLGLSTARDGDTALIGELLSAMAENDADYTNTFRGLVDGTARDQFTDPAVFDRWAVRWETRLADEPDPQAVMRAANPAFIPRNHRIEEMIQAALAGDMAPFERLMQVLSQPYDDQPDAADLRKPPLPDEEVQATFCGT